MGKYQKKVNRSIKIEKTAFYICVVIAAVLITYIGQYIKYDTQIKEINITHSEEMIALRAELQSDYEAKIAELEKYYEYGGDVTQIEKEAEYMAKVFYGYDRNHEDSDLRGVAWCIINRTEHYAYPDTIIGVCEQPKQWIGYSPDNPVLTEHYELALAELKIWHSGGHRPVSNKYIYLTWSSKEILLRDTFEENKSTNYWRMR